MSAQIDAVLSMWFGELDADGLAAPECAGRWWKSTAAFDQQIRTAFESLCGDALAGNYDHWVETVRGRLAYVIVLDQFYRNLYRGTAKMYAGDERALPAAIAGIDAGVAAQLGMDERAFLYMPLMHSEELADQERCVELFEREAVGLDGVAGKRIAGNLRAAIVHRDIVKRFGRFPHRNQILGRETTPEEATFLETGPTFS
jgi:uncharacterized protein (DUF924 family)